MVYFRTLLNKGDFMKKYQIFMEDEKRDVIINADGYTYEMRFISDNYSIPMYTFNRDNEIVAEFNIDSIIGIKLVPKSVGE